MKLGVLGVAALPAQPPHPSREFLTVRSPARAGLPEWAELRALVLETAEAA